MSDARRGAIAAGLAICHVHNAGRHETDVPTECNPFLPGGSAIREELRTRARESADPVERAGGVSGSPPPSSDVVSSGEHGNTGDDAPVLSSASRPGEASLASSTRACTRAMSPLVFSAYTEFFAGLDSACFFLEAQATQEAMARSIVSQIALSKAMNGMLNAQVDASVELLSHQRSASEHTRQLAAGLEEAQGRFRAVDQQLNASLTHVHGSLGAVQHGIDILQVYSHALVGA